MKQKKQRSKQIKEESKHNFNNISWNDVKIGNTIIRKCKNGIRGKVSAIQTWIFGIGDYRQSNKNSPFGFCITSFDNKKIEWIYPDKEKIEDFKIFTDIKM